MRSGSRSLLVGSVASLVLAGSVTFLAAENHRIIRVCVDSKTGALHLIRSDEHCGNRETLLEWNLDAPLGPQGPQGQHGPAGPPGPSGPTGQRGVQGATGPAGTTGPAGPAGATGLTGPAGPAGATGLTGPAGPAGATGLTGPAGQAGATGLTGPAGQAGATGLTGPAGPAGATGLTGPAGPAGSVGPAGPTGPAGIVGPAGPAGPAGSVGPAGPAGIVGPAGKDGKNGVDGAPGAPGPQGPAGPSAGGLKLVDSQATPQTIGYFQYPQLAVLQVGPELVWVVIDAKNRNFQTGTPAYYYALENCQGTPMMYVDLLRFGTVQGTTLFYPTGDPTPMIYKSVQDENGCSNFTNLNNGMVDTFAPVGQASLANFIPPFKIK
jgi:hypothetical protein